MGQSRTDEARHALSWMFYSLARRSPSRWGAVGAGRARAGGVGLEVELEGLGDARLQLGEVGQRGRQPRHAPLLPGHGARAVVGLELDTRFPQQPWAGGEGSGSAAGLCPPHTPSKLPDVIPSSTPSLQDPNPVPKPPFFHLSLHHPLAAFPLLTPGWFWGPPRAVPSLGVTRGAHQRAWAACWARRPWLCRRGRGRPTGPAA